MRNNIKIVKIQKRGFTQLLNRVKNSNKIALLITI